MRRFRHPFEIWKALWPHVYFYDKQREQIQAFRDAPEVCVVAGNELGKDFVWGFICPSFFMFPWAYFEESKFDEVDKGMRGRERTWETMLTVHTRRMLTTSVKSEHLGVLWGEIARFVLSAEPLDGVPLKDHLLLTDMELRFARERVETGANVMNYLRGTVISKQGAGEGMAGHHAAYTAGVCDEASSMSNVIHDQWLGWADKIGMFGNAFESQNVWRRHYEDSRASNWETRGEDGKLLRRAIQIKASDSPNVKLGLLQKARGQVPTNEILVPGIIDHAKYVERRNPKVLDKRQQTIKLDAEFWDGAEDKLVPAQWLRAAHIYDWQLGKRFGQGRDRKFPRWMGVDVGEGGDDSCWCVIDRHGLIELRSLKTPDTNEVIGVTMDMMDEFDVQAESVWFDRGGGGREHADRMRAGGEAVNDIGFGAEKNEPKRRMTFFAEKAEMHGDRDSYVNRRSRMAHDVKLTLERHTVKDAGDQPAAHWVRIEDGTLLEYCHATDDVLGFGVPEGYEALQQQLLCVPMKWDDTGRFKLIKKRSDNENEVTFHSLIGRSPDQFDALCLARFGMSARSARGVARG